MSRLCFFSVCTLLISLLFREIACNKAGVFGFQHVVKAAKESNSRKKLTKFDNTVIAEVKREVEVSKDEKETCTKQEEIREYNTKNSSFVKLWLSDFEINYYGLLVFGGDITTVKSQSVPDDEGQDDLEINKIIEENRLLEKLNSLRTHEEEAVESEDSPRFDEVTRKKILASGIQIISKKSSLEQEPETPKEIVKNVIVSPSELDDDDYSVGLITPNQQIVALEIIKGSKLIHTIQLNVEFEETVSETNNLIDSSLGMEYDEKGFLECVEIKKDLIQKIGKLKLENANLSLYAQKLRNKEKKTKEYRTVLENIEKNKQSLHDQNIELLKVERRIQQLSVEDRMEEGKAQNTTAETSESDEALRKRERRKVIIAAILEEAKRRKAADEASKEADKKEEEQKMAPAEEATEQKEEIPDQMKEIRNLAKMLVWLQENSSKTPAGVETRKERGANAIKSLQKICEEDRDHYIKVAEKIKNSFEEKVYKKNGKKT
ncbi:coiled coil-containing protein [Cryptosporidium canis]|uniref:Coiled coil-containing protein n=1 Tax=Cryptosporidium canis TaxID=195482 RepID=A0A9D5HYS2_9CRYT|nr:coiled coil-containing protein [Cryptosporidium canis]